MPSWTSVVRGAGFKPVAGWRLSGSIPPAGRLVFFYLIITTFTTEYYSFFKIVKKSPFYAELSFAAVSLFHELDWTFLFSEFETQSLPNTFYR